MLKESSLNTILVCKKKKGFPKKIEVQRSVLPNKFSRVIYVKQDAARCTGISFQFVTVLSVFWIIFVVNVYCGVDSSLIFLGQCDPEYLLRRIEFHAFIVVL